MQHCHQRKTVIDGDGIADILQQLWLIARFEQGVVGAADRLLGPAVLLQFLLLPFLLGNVLEEDADPHDDPRLITQGKLGGAEPAGFSPLQIGLFDVLVYSLAHDSGVILPIALYQFGGKEVAVILAHQCLW